MTNPGIILPGVVFWLVCGTLFAAEPPAGPAVLLRGPNLGYGFQPREGIRPILGLPGAARWGPAIPDTAEFTAVVFAPGRDYALALRSQTREVMLLSGLSDALSVSAIEAIPPGPDRLALSPSGTAAVLFYGAAGKLMVLKGLPQSPAVAWELSLAGLHAGWTSFSVTDGAEMVFVTTEEDGGFWLSVVTPGAGFCKLYFRPGSAVVTALPDRTACLVAGRDENQLWVVDGVTGSLTPIASENEGVSRPVDIAVTGDRRSLLVANSEPWSILAVDLQHGATTLLSAAPGPLSLRRLSGDVFQVAGETGEIAWLLDAGASPFRVVFIPRGGGETAASEGGAK